MRTPVGTTALAAALSLVAACDALASRDYVGDPLFTLTGTFVSTTVAPRDPVAGIALMWQDPSGPDGPGVAVTRVPVAITFPATFRVDVPTPPPASARFHYADSDVELAEAYVFVVADATASHLSAIGMDRGHALVFASGEVAPGSMAAAYLGGPVTAGYHLRRFVSTPAPAPAQQALVDRCVSGGAAPSACRARRAYQLAAAADDDPVRIAVTPP